MATQLERSILCAEVSLKEICDNFSARIQKKVRKGGTTANSIRKWYENLWTQVASVRGRVQTDRARMREQLIVFGRLISEVQESQSTWASRELNVPQPSVRKIRRKHLALRPYRLQVCRATNGEHIELPQGTKKRLQWCEFNLCVAITLLPIKLCYLSHHL
jgi:hypothetical protein